MSNQSSEKRAQSSKRVAQSSTMAEASEASKTKTMTITETNSQVTSYLAKQLATIISLHTCLFVAVTIFTKEEFVTDGLLLIIKPTGGGHNEGKG